MTKNELKKELYIVAGRVLEFEAITTAKDKEELKDYRVKTHMWLMELVKKYNDRYPDENIDDISNLINKNIIINGRQ